MTGGAAPATYRYLNREGRWLDFTRVGLEVRADGALALPSLPLLVGGPPAGLSELPRPEGLAGVAVAPGGDVLFTDPASSRLLVVDGCDGRERPAPCVAGPGDAPGELRAPRGLAVHPARAALLVADSGNDRVQVLALADLRVAEIWGERDDPRSIATDAAGSVYVVDAGSGRVEKLDLLGRPLPGFWRAVRSTGAIAATEVAATTVAGEVRVVILDRAGRVHVVDADGRQVARWDTGLGDPMGLAATGASVYLGDDAGRRLLAFGLDGAPRGAAVGFAGPVAAACLDGRGGLLVSPGGGHRPVRLALEGAFGRAGLMWGGPFANPSLESDPRHLVRAAIEPLGPGSHLRLHVCEQAGGGPAPPVTPGAPEPFADAAWQRRPLAPDAPETLVPGARGDELWIGLELAGEGGASPVVSQIRIDFAHETYLTHLPALYGEDAGSADVLARFLTLFESAFDRVQAGIDGLPLLFDPWAAPPAWLDWLGGWLAVELPEGWDDGRRRRAIATAFARDAARGTAADLREALRAGAGLEALIEEPLVQTSWWSLADAGASEAQAALSALGVGTVLAAGEPQGAVVGATAVLEGSYLSPQDRYATPLFADVAHQFTVRLYRGRDYSDDAVAAARALLETERPAHTSYHLCVVEPRMRVGLQARVGVDAIVAGPPEATPAGVPSSGGLVLGGAPAGRLGQDARIGRTPLTDSATPGRA